jgi:hypothetical protein
LAGITLKFNKGGRRGSRIEKKKRRRKGDKIYEKFNKRVERRIEGL